MSDYDWLHLVDDAPNDSSAVNVRNDLRGFLPGVWRDAKGIVRTENLLILGVAAGAAIGIRQDLDDQVRHDTAANPDRWGEFSHTLGKLGEAPIQVPLLAVLWGTSVWMQDAELNGFAHTVVSAYAINGLAVLAIKAVTDTDRPDPDWNGGRWGFPSFHAASSFAIAGVVEEYYGWPAALPAYTLAGLISWSRIDERDHDLSDVVFGAAMGWVIGKSVAGTHLRNDGRVMLLPWSHPYEPAQGVALEVRY
ncbi:MAG: phosphatase PAP2 family protein [Planctomycetaceae bacterium]|nr:phosphatase PAP2 family protein [Planctomycetaceae bacterium]